MGTFKIVKLVDPIVVQTNGVNASITGNTAGVPAVVSSGTLFLAGGNNITLSQDQNTVSIIGGAGGGGGGGIAASAGTQSVSTGTVVFSNSNGITFGMSGSSRITASHNGLTTQTVQTQNMVSVLGSTGNVSFQNSNGITFGGNASTITASHNGITSQTVQTQNLMTVNGTQGEVTISGGNGVTVGNNASTITLSVRTDYQSSNANYLTSQSNQALSGSNGSFTFQTATLGNLNGLSFYTSNGSIVGSYTVPTVPAQTEYVLSNSNGVSFGTNGSTVTATVATTYAASNHSHGNPTLALTNLSGTTASASNGLTLSLSAANPSQTVQTQNLHNVTLSGNTAGVMAQISSGTMTLAGGNNITLSQNGNAVTISGANTVAQTNQTLGLYGSSNTTGQSSSSTFDARSITFRGAGVASVGMSAGEVVISVPSGGGAGDGVNILAAGTQTANTTGTVLFSNSNGVSFGMNNSSLITASHNGLTTQTVQTQNMVSVLGSTGDISFANGNGVTFGGNASTVTASHNGLTSQSNQALSGSNGSFTFQTATFGNLNGMSFYTSNGSFVGSYTVPTVTNSSWTVSDAATSATVGRLAFTNSNGITMTLSTSNNGNHTLIASHNGLTTQTNPAFSAGGGSSTFQTLSFSNANGISFSNNAGQVQASYTVPTVTNSSLTMQAGASTLSSVSRIHFGDSNGVSFGASTSNNGSITITATVATNYLTSQSNQNITAANGGFAFQTLSFSNLNGVSFGTSAGSAITASVNTSYRASNDAIGLNTAQSNVTWTANSSGLSLDARGYAGTGTTFNGANISGSITQNSNGLQLSLSAGAGGGVTPVASASNGSFSFTTLGFSNANNVTFGTSAGSIITASVAAPGAAAENNNINLLGANTAGNTTASGSTIGWSGINLTLSGTNGSVVNVSAPATSSLSATGQVSLSTNGSTISIGVPSAVTYSRYNEFKESPVVAGQQGQATLHIQPWLIPNLQFDRVIINNIISNATNSSGSLTLSHWFGVYTRTASTLSLLYSTSASTNFTGSGTAGSYSLYGGWRGLSVGLTQTLTEGMYWLGVIQRSTTGGANLSVSQALVSQMNTNFSGIVGAASNATNQLTLGLGVYSASTTAMPGSVGFSQIQGTASLALRPPSFYFMSGTV